MALMSPVVSPNMPRCKSPPRTSSKLSELLATSQLQITQWAKDRASDARADAQEHLVALQRKREHVDDLQADLKSILQKIEIARRVKQEGSHLGEAMRASVAAAGQRSSRMSTVKGKLGDSHEEILQDLQNTEFQLAEQRCASQAKLAGVTQFLDVYRDRLGLDIVPGSKSVRMGFTFIEDDHTKQSSFTLGLEDSPSTAYRISACDPPVPELPELLDRLNKETRSASALPAFACGMRKAFKKHATNCAN